MRIPPLLPLLALLLLADVAAAQHAGDMLLASTASGGGALAVQYDFAQAVVVTPTASGGGNTLYSGTDPGWDQLRSAGGGVFPLPAGVQLRVEVVSLDAGVSLKVGTTTLDAPGESALLGTTSATAGTGVHLHPVWQLVLPTGTVAQRAITWKLTTTTAGYAASSVCTSLVTNAVPTTTTSSSTTTTAPVGVTTTTLSGATTSTSTTTVTASSSTTTTTPPPPVVEEVLSGKLLRLTTKPAVPTKQALVVLSHDPSLTAGTPDDAPTAVGATLTLHRPGGAIGSWSLPSVAWKRLEKRGVTKGFVYADRSLALGPIRGVTLKPGRQLKIVGAGAGLGLDLADDPSPVGVALRAGTRRWCLAFGGTVRFAADRLLEAKDAAAPAACAE